MNVFPVGHQIYNQENIPETLNLIYFIEFFEIVLARFFIALETISGTNTGIGRRITYWGSITFNSECYNKKQGTNNGWKCITAQD